MKLPTEVINGVEVQPKLVDRINVCSQCHFKYKCDLDWCSGYSRKDNNDVYFVKVSE